MKEKSALFLTFIFISFIFLFNLGAGSLNAWDEGFYASVARSMIERGDWINLYFADVSWCDKPPLCMWMTAIFYKLFGVNEFSARFFSAFSGIGACLIAYLLGKKLFSKKIGLISALLLAGTCHFIQFAKAGTLDMPLTFFVSLAVYFFILSEENKRFILCFFIAWALAFMVKSFGSFSIFAIVIVYSAIQRNWKNIFNRYTLPGVFIFFIIISIWHIAAFHDSWETFLQQSFRSHLWTRTGQAIDNHTGGILTYINVILYKAKPWGVLGLAGIPFLLLNLVRKKINSQAWIILVWVIFYLVAFSIVKTKLHWYIMPIYPAIMIIAAVFLEKILKSKTIAIVFIVTIISVGYFGIKKDIFTLDYNPSIKKFAQDVRKQNQKKEPVYLYDIGGDPSVEFYIGGEARSLYKEEDLMKVIALGKCVIVTRPQSSALSMIPSTRNIIKSSNGEFIAVIS
ncbi:dolichyl-phosphate-mannose-protein mannosyltransferase family protein [Candidatus Omnitrophus magneticus]|uniref:Dolichyl-phosphate-mannose-protein mannosyltransferase family protein n=1 Tax=Candidatus Omnitrophus magneticus TaxID=1609969 RepID=A0A0F0CQU7_9BACT|nr:dolichyl-phosphate-mannose-protein mannosyltransferase family protein [Candidatus Omnitrophus magneticus]